MPAKKPSTAKRRPAPNLSHVPVEVLQQLSDAVKSGHWAFAVWSVSAGTIHLERTVQDFPTADLDKSVAMLAESLQSLKVA